MAAWSTQRDFSSRFPNVSRLGLGVSVLFALIQIAEAYTYCRNSYSYTYYSCSDYEYCCQSNKCCNSSALTLSIYQLWYFWFCLILFIVLCSGGIFGWYRKRYLRRHTVVTNVTATGTTVVTAPDHTIATLRTGQPMYPATVMAPPSYTMATSYPAPPTIDPAHPAYPPPAYTDPAYPPPPSCGPGLPAMQRHSDPYPRASPRMSGGQQMHSLGPPILPPVQRQAVHQTIAPPLHNGVQNLPPPTL
ncbi:vesicular, overexpressed in cancer, prosurvival protein 1 [Lingula anatina]|uniref:WW domain binding protein VOPP1 n=1 Tax=Lingula anatina TaxID=7574 RepID=A0A2R2MSS9_LINAN|nr:vesicular, overexpressed in cancer, prosurvival protein 1 [Lingula anatina]|eukprot:XP_023933325.1 vesicular, overexpressed in cancer, prosurvival protein 1 [Lingula anatina]